MKNKQQFSSNNSVVQTRNMVRAFCFDISYCQLYLKMMTNIFLTIVSNILHTLVEHGCLMHWLVFKQH